MTDPSAPHDDLATRLLDAALPHVAFDGWTDATFRNAVAETGTDPALARAVCPRGALDLAVAWHRRGDAAMQDRLNRADLAGMKFRDRIAAVLRFRLEAVEGDKEAVRRGATLFALPQHAATGSRLIWDTCDAVWTALGDSSDDINWYTKRATLSGVYGALVLYWLGDTSSGHAASWAFLDRRIEDVMRIETLKAKARDNPVLRRLMAGPAWAAGKVRAPARTPPPDLPGLWTPPR